MILMTAATGNTGVHTVKALRDRDLPVRVLSRSDKVDAFKQDGVETVRADLLDIPALEAAMEGIEAVVHVGPAFDPREVTMGQNVIDVAKRVGVERIVLYSVIHPTIEFMLNHQAKMRVEDYLLSSDMAFTIVQPMHYMQTARVAEVVEKGVFWLPWSMKSKLGFVDLADVGEVVAKVLTEDGHLYANYPLCGTDLLSGDEVAAIIAAESGKEIKSEQMPIPDFIEMIGGRQSLPPHTINAMYRLCTYYDLHGLRSNPNVLRWLLGREPTTMAEYVRRELASA